MDQPGIVATPARVHLKKIIGEKITLFLSSSASEKFVSRNRFGGPVPRPPAAHPPHSRLNVVLTYAIPPIQYYLYVEQTAPAAVESRACVRENCATHFYVLLGLNGPLTAMTDAAAILALYLRQEGPVDSNIGSTVSCMVTHIARVWINRVGCQSCSWSGGTRKNNISLSLSAPDNLVSRNGFGSPVPRQPAHLHIQDEPGAYLLRGSSRVPRQCSYIYLKPLYAIGSVPSLWGHAIAYNGVHCREFQTVAALAGHHRPISLRLSFPRPLLV